jgi:hypothetical protein
MKVTNLRPPIRTETISPARIMRSIVAREIRKSFAAF